MAKPRSVSRRRVSVRDGETLVIVESPAKARTIERLLGDGYRVLASFGHVRDLPRSEREVPSAERRAYGRLAGVDPNNDFSTLYVVPDDKREVVRALQSAVRSASRLILATDGDREGEAIGWHLRELLQPTCPVQRIVFHEITPNAIQHALEHPRELDMRLVHAQEGRRILDRLVGYELSPVLWREIGKFARSAGRVQSVAVRLLVERERERMKFRSGSCWGVQANLHAKGGDKGQVKLDLVELNGDRVAALGDVDPATGSIPDQDGLVVLDESRAQGLVQALSNVKFHLYEVERKPFEDRPWPPFTTSTLQQEGSYRLGMSPAQVMEAAQGLYERGLITYMRTDSVNLSEQAIRGAREAVREAFGGEYLSDSPRRYKGRVKNAQEAHEAIRPAGAHMRSPEEVQGNIEGGWLRVYELIWARTLATQMADARGSDVTVWCSAKSTDGDDAVFRGEARAYEFDGYRRVYGQAVGGASVLGEVEPGPVGVSDLNAVEQATEPPPRFSEARLVKELEDRGIGRPSTYASVIKTIQSRDYAWKKRGVLVPSWTAFLVVQLLEDRFGRLVDYDFTSGMEEGLDGVARGDLEVTSWLRAQYFGGEGLEVEGLQEMLSRGGARQGDLVLHLEDDEGNPVTVRPGKQGPVVIAGGTEASLPLRVDPTELTVAAVDALEERTVGGCRSLGHDPDSGLEVLLLDGRYGPYVQLGLSDGVEVPHRVSLLTSMVPAKVTLEDALRLLSLPRVVGEDTSGLEIVALVGKYGPYLRRGDGQTRNLRQEDLVFTIELDEAEELFRKAKSRGGRGGYRPRRGYGRRRSR